MAGSQVMGPIKTSKLLGEGIDGQVYSADASHFNFNLSRKSEQYAIKVFDHP